MKVRKIVEKQRIIKHERNNEAVYKYCELCIYCKVNVITYFHISLFQTFRNISDEYYTNRSRVEYLVYG